MPPVYEQRVAIRAVAINAVTWTDIVGLSMLPIDCNLIIIYNNTGVDIFLRTDPNNSNSQVTIGAGLQFELGSPSGLRQGTRFTRNGDPSCSLLSSSGNVSPLVESVF